MPAFRYEAVDPGGATRKGVVNADSPRAARADLRTQGLTPLSVEAIAAQVDESGATRSRGFGERLSQVELALFTRQLASLLEAGLPLEQAFTALLERAANSQQADLERRTLTIAGLLEPVLILAMGLVVLLIVLAVLMPIIEINQLVR